MVLRASKKGRGKERRHAHQYGEIVMAPLLTIARNRLLREVQITQRPEEQEGTRTLEGVALCSCSLVPQCH